jgi:hypothetical protein
MEAIVDKIYEEFYQKRKQYEALSADQNDLEEIKEIERQVRKRKNK